MASPFSFMGIVKEAEGVERAEEEVEVRLRADQVLQWLADRRAVASWAPRTAACRRTARELLVLPPSSSSSSSSSSLATSYLALRDELDRLVRLRDPARSLFGSYVDPELANYEKVLAMYRQDNAHLADSAQSLLEICGTLRSEKRAVEKAQKGLIDLNKLEDGLLAELESHKRQFKRYCTELGIEGGSDITAEIAGLVSQLPEWLQRIEDASRSVQGAVNYYGAFIEYVNRSCGGEHGDSAPPCPVLRFVIEHGNTSRLELERVLRPGSQAAVADDAVESVPAAVPTEIDWNVEPVVVAADGSGGEIKWDIECVDDGVDGADAANVAGIEMVSEAVLTSEDVSDQPVWAGESVLSSLDSRSEFLDDVHELLAFLQNRVREKKEASAGRQDALSALDCPEELRNVNKLDQLQGMLDNVMALVRLTDATQLNQLLQIKGSKRYVSRLAASVRRKLELEQQSRERLEELASRRAAMQTTLTQSGPRIAQMEKQAKKLCRLLEAEMGAKFKRPVKIKMPPL